MSLLCLTFRHDRYQKYLKVGAVRAVDIQAETLEQIRKMLLHEPERNSFDVAYEEVFKRLVIVEIHKARTNCRLPLLTSRQTSLEEHAYPSYLFSPQYLEIVQTPELARRRTIDENKKRNDLPEAKEDEVR